MYNDQFTRMEALFKELSGKIDGLDKKLTARLDDTDKKLQELVDDEYYHDDEDDKPKQTTVPRRNEVAPIDITDFIDEDEIYKLGQRVPYSRIKDSSDLEAFRKFITYVRMHEDQFTSEEVDYAGFSDKTFSDVRLADKARRILGRAYLRMYKKQWPFKFERGFMHKYQGQFAWSWLDGSRD